MEHQTRTALDANEVATSKFRTIWISNVVYLLLNGNNYPTYFLFLSHINQLIKFHSFIDIGQNGHEFLMSFLSHLKNSQHACFIKNEKPSATPRVFILDKTLLLVF